MTICTVIVMSVLYIIVGVKYHYFILYAQRRKPVVSNLALKLNFKPWRTFDLKSNTN